MKYKTINPLVILNKLDSKIKSGNNIKVLDGIKVELVLSKNNVKVLEMIKSGHAPECVCCKEKIVFHVNENRKNKLPILSLKMKNLDIVTFDHNLLKSLGGIDDVSNYTLMCNTCNLERSSIFAELKDFIEFKRTHTYSPTPDDSNFCFIDFSKNMRLARVDVHAITIDMVNSWEPVVQEQLFIKMPRELKLNIIKNIIKSDASEKLNRSEVNEVLKFNIQKNLPKYLPNFGVGKNDNRKLPTVKKEIHKKNIKMIDSVTKMKPTIGMKVSFLLHKTKQVLFTK